jgi:hypothetical protein
MKDFFLDLDGGQLRISEEKGLLKFEAGAVHLEDPKVTTITLFLSESDISQIGDWIKNVRLQKEN